MSRATTRSNVRRNIDDPSIPELEPQEEIDYTLRNVGMSFKDSNQSIGNFDLIITTKRVVLLGELMSFDFDIPYITLHAVTRDPASYPQPCIYCQLNYEIDDDANNLEVESENNEEITSVVLLQPKDEMFIIPQDPENHLNDIFKALSHAAMLNPDPSDGGDDDSDGDDFIYNQEEVELGAREALRLDHLESVFNVPDSLISDSEKFEDIAEEEKGTKE